MPYLPFRVTPVLVVVAALMLSACGGTRPFKKSIQQEESLVFGYIDMDEAPCSLDWVDMKRLQPKTDKPYYGFAVKDGMFYRTYTPPGVYKFDAFGGSSFIRNANYTFKFPQGKGEMDREIKKTGIYYVGSYKYVKVKTGFFQPGKFDYERVQRPTEKELLERLLLIADHPEWRGAIRQRIKELSK